MNLLYFYLFLCQGNIRHILYASVKTGRLKLSKEQREQRCLTPPNTHTHTPHISTSNVCLILLCMIFEMGIFKMMWHKHTLTYANASSGDGTEHRTQTSVLWHENDATQIKTADADLNTDTTEDKEALKGDKMHEWSKFVAKHRTHKAVSFFETEILWWFGTTLIWRGVL